MSNSKLDRHSGACSTFIPKTNTGDTRPPMTFFGSSDFTSESNKISFMMPDSRIISIDNNFEGITPMIYDYIIYAEKEHTYLMYITSINSITNNVTSVNINLLDQWDTLIDSSESEAINLSITCINKNLTTDRLKTNGIVSNPSYTSQMAKMEGAVDSYTQSTQSYGLGFNITSKTSVPLGNYMIQLEFNTTQSSPAMDTMIASKFITPFGSDPENMTFRGYMSRYTDRIKTTNFDNEKLDDFTVIIKDYNDGVGKINFSKDIILPDKVLDDANKNGHRYTCKVYAYINIKETIYQKMFVADISDDVYNLIEENGGIPD